MKKKYLGLGGCFIHPDPTMCTLLRVVMSKSFWAKSFEVKWRKAWQTVNRWNEFCSLVWCFPWEGPMDVIRSFMAAILDWIGVRTMSDFIHAPMRGCSDGCSKGEGICGWIGWAATKGGRHTDIRNRKGEGYEPPNSSRFFEVIYIRMFLWVAQGCLGRLEGQTCCKSLSAFIALGEFLRRYEHQCAAVFFGISKGCHFQGSNPPHHHPWWS